MADGREVRSIGISAEVREEEGGGIRVEGYAAVFNQ